MISNSKNTHQQRYSLQSLLSHALKRDLSRSFASTVPLGRFWGLRTFLFIFLFIFFVSTIEAADLSDKGDMPEFQGISQWYNSQPLNKELLKGKVVLVDFWTYTCVNCLRTLPYLGAWHQKYKDRGLVIIGVHSPEFDFEKDPANVKKAVSDLKISYPVALDNTMSTWNAFGNEYWPAHYFVDRRGKIRFTHFGEGGYEESEGVIQTLLAENAGPLPTTQPTTLPSTLPTTIPTTQPTTQPTTLPTTLPSTLPTTQPFVASTMPTGVDFNEIKSPETYLGLVRRERVVTSGRDLLLNEWSYEGNWRVHGDRISLTDGTGKIRFHFFATKVNLVLHPGTQSAKVMVKIDGQVLPDAKAGRDVKGGKLEIKEPRLYELINLGPKGEEHTIEIEFLTPGVQAYAFTFG